MDIEVQYRHNLQSNYMIMKNSSIIVNDYRLNMLLKNDIAGFLKFCVSCVDGEVELSYLISSKQSVKDLFERKKLKYDELHILLNGIVNVADKAHKYLLRADDILLEPEYMYMDYNYSEVWFCYYPNSGNIFNDEIKKLIQKILTITDHSDRKAVEFIYDIFDICGKSGFLIKDIEEYIENFSKEDFREIRENISYNEEEYNAADIKDTVGIVCEKTEKEEVYQSNISDEIGEMIKNNIIIKKISEFFGINEKMKLNKNEIKIPQKCSKESYYREINYYNAEDSAEDIKENKTMLLGDLTENKNRMLISMAGQENIQIDKYPFIIGKLRTDMDYVIDDKLVSRIHLKIDKKSDMEYYIEDINSKNGTYVNGTRLEPYERKRIEIGDRISIAVFDYIFQ